MAVEIIGTVKSVPGYQFMNAETAFEVTGNTGNLAFYDAVRSHVAGGVDAPWETKGAIGTTGIIPCANFIGAHGKNNFRAQFCRQYQGNLVAIGLGAQGQFDQEQIDVGEGTEAFLKELTNKAIDGPNISVRGHFTKQVIERLGFGDYVEVLGCPSLFLNPSKKLGKIIERNTKGQLTKFSACAGSPLGGKKYENLEAKLANIITRASGSYVVQHPLHFVQLGMGQFGHMPDNLVTRYHKALKPELTIHQFKKWCRRHLQVFFNLDAWIDHMQSHDIMVGTRIHGTMLALQAGIPAVCLIHDTRTEEMCKIMKIPYIFIDQLDLANIEDAVREKVISYNWHEFDENREYLRQRYGKFLNRNKVQLAQRFQ